MPGFSVEVVVLKCPRIKRGSLLTAVGLLLLSLVINLTSRANAVEIDALIGFGQGSTIKGYYRPQTWTPLTVFVTGAGVSGRARVQVHLINETYSTTYVRDIDLPDGNVNVATGFTLDLSDHDETFQYRGVTGIEVTLLQDGRKKASAVYSLPRVLDPLSFNVLALTKDGSGLNVLAKKKLHLVHRLSNGSDALSIMNRKAARSADGDNEAPLQLLYTDSRALPVSAQGYDAIDAIALGDQSLDGLTNEQIEAIRGYVRRGGLLLISGGGDLARLKSSLLAELLPVAPASVQLVSSISALEDRYQSPLRSKSPFALAQGVAKPGTDVLLAQGKAPLIAAKAYGLGRVVFTSFDFLDPAIRGWSAAPSLWLDLFCTRHTDVTALEVLGHQNGSRWTSYYGSDPRNMTRLIDALAGKKANATPSPWLIIGFVIIYILLMVPVNFFVLKRLDKREFAWISIPALILLFTISAYLIGLNLKGGALSAHRGILVETTANSDQAVGMGLTSIYSPSREQYDILFGTGGKFTENGIPYEISPNAGSAHKITVETTNSANIVRQAEIRLWDQRTFVSSVAVPVGEGVVAKVRMVDNNNAEVVVTNKTPYDLKRCHILSASGVVEVGDLNAGQSSKALRFLWPVPTPGSALFNLNENPFTKLSFSQTGLAPGGDYTYARLSERPTRDLILHSFSSVLAEDQANRNWQGNYTEDNFNGIRPVLMVGILSNPIFSMKINNQNAPIADEVGMMVVHLPPPVNARGKTRSVSNPFSDAPVLKFQQHGDKSEQLDPRDARPQY